MKSTIHILTLLVNASAVAATCENRTDAEKACKERAFSQVGYLDSSRGEKLSVGSIRYAVIDSGVFGQPPIRNCIYSYKAFSRDYEGNLAPRTIMGVGAVIKNEDTDSQRQFPCENPNSVVDQALK